MGFKIEKAGMEGVEEIAELYVPLSPLKFDALPSSFASLVQSFDSIHAILRLGSERTV